MFAFFRLSILIFLCHSKPCYSLSTFPYNKLKHPNFSHAISKHVKSRDEVSYELTRARKVPNF